jgi:hypothetical protein
MILFTNGDSWTQGDSPAQDINWKATKTEEWYDIIPNFGKLYNNNHKVDTKILYKFYDSPVWPKELGKRLGVETWNAGRLGDSNYDIKISTVQSLEWLKAQGKKNIFAIIGWTSQIRIPIYTVDTSGKTKIIQQRPGNVEAANEIYSRHNYIQNEFLHHILDLQNYFKVNNIDYLMFNAFDPFTDFNAQYMSKAIDRTKWINHTVTPAHFKEYIFQKFELSNWNESPYFITSHPRDISHRAWAKYLYNYIQSL